MISRILLACLTVCLAATTVCAETINLLNWESYIEPSILDAWSAKTGVAVRQTYYDSGDARDKILSDPSSNVDLVVISDNSSRLYGRRGILERLSLATIPAFDEHPADLRGRCGSFGVPYFYGTMGILYRSDKVPVGPTSWNDLMSPAATLKGHVAMFDDPTEMFVAPLIALGKSINSTDQTTMKAAFELLKAQSGFVRTYDYIVTSLQNEIYGEQIFMALGYSGDQYVLNDIPKSAGTWRFAMPTEGSLYWLDCMSVVAASPRKALALDLLNHISSAPSALANAVSLRRPTTNSKALESVPTAIRQDEAIYPSPALLAKSQAPEELTSDAIQTRRRIISSLVNFRDPK